MNSKNPIVAVVGMPGSGKSEMTKHLVNQGWNSIYFGSVTLKELDILGLEYTPKNEKTVREQLRSELGQDAFAKKLYDDILLSSENGPVVLDGLYSWSEYKYLLDKFENQLYLISIVANSSTRYERLKTRTIRPLCKKDAKNRDIAEIENIEKGGPIAFGDYYILNNTSIEDFYMQCEKVTKDVLYDHK